MTRNTLAGVNKIMITLTLYFEDEKRGHLC